LLLGSWVLTSPVLPPESEEENAPPAKVVPYTPPRKAPAMPPGTPETGLPEEQPRAKRAMTRDEIYQAREGQREQVQRNQQNSGSGMMPSGMRRPMPMAPTELAQPGTPGMPQMPEAPTQGGPAGAGRQAASNMPNAPTNYRPPSTAAPPNPNTSYYSALSQQRDLAGTAAYRSYTGPPPPEKVYAGTQVPSSGISPYMQLFRNDTAGGTIDNYTTLVRPQLQQQRLNQQFGTDLFGLQRDARLQQASMQRMQNIDRSLQSVSTPQFYMNGGGYYPGNQGYGNQGYGNQGYGNQGGNQGYGNPYGP
jgi:hypothetical protein